MIHSPIPFTVFQRASEFRSFVSTSALGSRAFTQHDPVIPTVPTEFRKLFSDSVRTSSLSGHFVAALPADTFLEVVVLARARFDLTAQRSRALLAAATLPTIDLVQVACDSSALLRDPFGALDAFAEKSAPSRLSLAVIDSPAYADVPDRLLLRDIAVSVSPVFDPAFVPSTSHAAVRPQMADLQPAINALFQTNYSKGEVMIVTLSSFLALDALPNPPLTHLSNVWQTEKYQSDLGRLLYDYRNLSTGTPVNSETCRDLYRSRYGDLIYPSTSDYISYFWNACSVFPNADITITKSDVHRAYHRFRWSSHGSFLLALLLSDSLVAIPVTGGFGSNGPPFIYDVVARSLEFLHTQRLLAQGISARIGRTYVDDFPIFSPPVFGLAEMDFHDAEVNKLLGPFAAHKREQHHILDVIGTRFDTRLRTVGISSKGYLKLVFMFFTLLPSTLSSANLFPVRLLQSLTGLVARYSFFIPLLRYTPSVFYRLLRGHPTRSRRLSRLAISTITLWRHFLRFAFDYPSVLTTSMPDFFHNSPGSYDPSLLQGFYASYSDATLSVLGLFVPSLGWCEILVNSFTSLPVSIANLEFLAFILSYLFAHHLTPAATHIHLFVDNQNAETWSRGKFNTDSNLSFSLVILNSMLQSMLCVVQTRSYIRSADNIDADAISRQSFLNSASLPRYSVTSATLQFLQSSVEHPENDLLLSLPRLLTLLPLGAFYRS